LSAGQRRLAAIVFTDVVGFSALSQHDEAMAIQLLDAHNSLVRAIVQRHGGREVKTIGDSFLLEFSSALEAVNFAVDAQMELRRFGGSAADVEKLLVRIGIHVGDVVHRDGDIFGDAVNIASRIVEVAEAGGICVSSHVRDQVMNKVQFTLEKMPRQSLKNIELEVDLYQVVLPWESEAGVGTPVAANRIAILPFANISPDPGDSYFADGLTEELISALSEVRGLRVIARTSVNHYKDAARNVRQIGAELRVSHLLEGSVRKAGKRIRITAHLVETDSQEEIWSATYEEDLVDVFAIQSDIAARVVDSLKVRLLSTEKARIKSKETDNIAAYVAYLKGRSLLREGTEKAVRSAREQFEFAIREDENYAKAYSGMADSMILLGDYLFAPVPVALEEATRCVRKALALDPDLAEARVSLAMLLMYDYRFGEAEEEFRRAIETNPSYATGHHWYSTCLQTFGRLDDALGQAMQAEELDPMSSWITISLIYRLIGFGRDDEIKKRIRKLEGIDPESPLVDEARMAFSFAKRDWEAALTHLNKMIERDPADPFLDMDVAYIYAATGRQKEAMNLVEKLKKVSDDAKMKGQALAFVYVGLGDLDRAFEWLNYAMAKKEFFISWVRGYPLFEPVRSDPRFADLLRAAKLPVDQLGS
jgi:adenylate cyclase